MSKQPTDFQSYVRSQTGGGTVARPSGAPDYAFSADVAMLRAFERIRPVELAAASVVRASAQLMDAQQLGTMLRVSDRQIPHLHAIAQGCADTLGIPLPKLYVANSPVINAYTFGTNNDAFIVVHSALLDHFDDDELRFVIGHEMGHVQNRHVVYGTVLRVLKTSAAIFLRWIIAPAEVALATWSRRAEITCDRAGLLCSRDLDSARRSFLKLACGSQKLYAQIDLDAYLEQFEDGRGNLGRYQEAFATHPYLPKRIHALQVFAESDLYRRAAGLGAGGIGMPEVDSRTARIIEIADPSLDRAPGAADGKA
ncbi:MAG: M48 family metallopeptidase [Sandaracinaceae bacterium]|nr:M48 family metallopeptidase [Myxococcales bacterium]MCB9658973.1 M48 family metallopeptidase [Sandaracinaceae bacterium]